MKTWKSSMKDIKGVITLQIEKGVKPETRTGVQKQNISYLCDIIVDQLCGSPGVIVFSGGVSSVSDVRGRQDTVGQHVFVVWLQLSGGHHAADSC